MTLWGWDASHYDGTLTPAILNRAKAEGITFFTHKLAEGITDTEGTHDDTALAAARSAGIEFVGGYVVPRTLDSAAQVDYWWQILNNSEPWWRDFPGWFNQIDLERWSYDPVSAAKGIDCAKRWRDKTGRQTILYASHGQYADQLTAWDGPLWNADYVSATAGSPAAMYPGDSWTPLHGTWRGGWTPYSGQKPTILQFTSSATIAGLTTCDANAYPGTVEQFRALITGDDMDAVQNYRLKILFENWDPTRDQWIAAGGDPAVWDAAQAAGTARNGVKQTFNAFNDEFTALSGKVDGLTKQVTALAAKVPAAAAAPTQDQVNTGILNAMLDPRVQQGIGAAIAQHLHVS